MYLSKGKSPVSKQVHEVLRTTTVRSFEGGLNVADTDLNMSPKFARVLDNIERNLDGTLSVRPGTRLRARLSPNGDTSRIINITQFNDYIISVQFNGTVSRTDGAGNVTYMAPPAGGAWSGGVLIANFTIFNSDLIIVDGKDKPYIIVGQVGKPNFMTLQLLRDLGAVGESNAFVPISKYVVTHGRYVVHANLVDPLDASKNKPSSISISARDTSGAYAGTTPVPAIPGVEIDLGSRVSLGSPVITGLVSYRDKLIVSFERGVLPMTLNVFTGSPPVHTPGDDGFIAESGCLGHRSMVNVGDDTYFCDNIGVNTLQRVSLVNTLRPRRTSYLIDSLITRSLNALTPNQIAQFVFAVYDLRNSRYMLFVPTLNAGGQIVETVVYSYTTIAQLQISAWARLRGWAFTAACRTALQNIIFSFSNKLYSYEFDDAENCADFMGDVDFAADGSGVAQTFIWELPWADFDKRLNSKTIKYIHTDTEGTGSFTLDAFSDNIRKDDTGQIDAPQLTMDFDAASSLGYGRDGYGKSYGGGSTGHPTNEERLYGFPMKANLVKLLYRGVTKKPVKFISISLGYTRGSVRRA